MNRGSSMFCNILLAVLSGACYALAFPPTGWRILIVVGVGGLLYISWSNSSRNAFRLGLLHGLVAYGIGLSWLYELFSSAAFALFCVMAIFHGLFALFLGRASAIGWSGWKWALFAAANWGAWEFVRAELFPLRFPWMTVGLAVGPNAVLPMIGVYGVGMVVVFAIALACARKWIPSLLFFSGLALSIFLFPKFEGSASRNSSTVSVAAVQMEERVLEDYLRATEALPAEVQYVVWPEYAIYHDVRSHEKDWAKLVSLCREKSITLTLGTRDLSERDAWRNIALTMDGGGELGVHQKVHTVHFFDDGMPGESTLPVETSHGRVGTPICFDCDYEGVIRRMTSAGAEMFMIPVMDHRSWTARQHEQHGELFRIRAAENGRWMMVCATSGASKVIDPHGHVHEKLAAMEEGVLLGRLTETQTLTVYTRFGWLFPWLVFGTGLLACLVVFLRKMPTEGADS